MPMREYTDWRIDDNGNWENVGISDNLGGDFSSDAHNFHLFDLHDVSPKLEENIYFLTTKKYWRCLKISGTDARTYSLVFVFNYSIWYSMELQQYAKWKFYHYESYIQIRQLVVDKCWKNRVLKRAAYNIFCNTSLN